MPRTRRSPAVKRPGGRSFAGKSKAQKAAVRKATRTAAKSARTNYERQWIPGFATRYAQKTGIMLSEHQVRRNKDFQRAVQVVKSAKRRSKAPGKPLAKALVELGVREPDFRGQVGNSPGRGGPYRTSRGNRSRGHRLYGTRGGGRRNTP